MRKLHKLIAKDIFDCLSEEERKQLEELCRERGIGAEAYQRMKEEIVSRGLHEEIVEARRGRKGGRVIGMWRYAAVLLLPLAVAAYLLLGTEKDVAVQVSESVQMESKIPVVERKEPKVILASGEEVYLNRKEEQGQVVPNAVNKGNELVYEKNRYEAVSEPKVEYNTIVVPKGGEFQLVLADGTKVWLNEDTELKFPVNFAGALREVYLESGEAYLEVAKDKEHPFVVHTTGGDVQVLGTQFNVKSLEDNKMEATLVEGSVQVSSGVAKTVLVPNQQALVGKDGKDISVKEVDVEEVVCWKDNIFLFKDVRLEEIMERLSDWYGFQVEYRNQPVKNEKFYISIDKYGEVDKILELMSEVSGVRFEIHDRTVSVSKK